MIMKKLVRVSKTCKWKSVTMQISANGLCILCTITELTCICYGCYFVQQLKLMEFLSQHSQTTTGYFPCIRTLQDQCSRCSVASLMTRQVVEVRAEHHNCTIQFVQYGCMGKTSVPSRLQIYKLTAIIFTAINHIDTINFSLITALHEYMGG